MTKDFNDQNENQDISSEQQDPNQNSQYVNDPQNDQEINNNYTMPETPQRSGKGVLLFIIIVALVIIVGFKEHILSFINQYTHKKPQQEIARPVQENTTSQDDAPSADPAQLASAAPAADVSATPPTATVSPTPTAAVSPTPGSFTSAEKQEIVKIVQDYIQNNPNVILESLKGMEQQMAKDRSVKAQDYIKSNIKSITDNKPYLGNPNGTLVITKFFDFKCGYCKKGHAAIETLINTTPNLKVYLVELPIMGQQSILATQASLAVFNIAPLKFAKFNAGLMAASNIDDTTIKALATQNGINVQALLTAMKSPKIEQDINTNMAIAREVGLQGVPAFIIGNEFIPGFIDYDALKTKIAALQKQTQPRT
jgi:protein-disulfide isomerase